MNPTNTTAIELAQRDIKEIFDALQICKGVNCAPNPSMQLALNKTSITREVLKCLKTSLSGNQTGRQHVNVPDGRKIIYALFDVASDKPLANEKLSAVLANFLVDFVNFRRQVGRDEFETKIDFEINRLNLTW